MGTRASFSVAELAMAFEVKYWRGS
jgi:hypothetical protein